ncbi:LysM peptidoglycan-binding domain-containing protein [Streptomyces sp. CBMA152]|uniref:LysM peptidoglycan-binding domain-containing protein n=1 Tax=Streptomyces sp. CBMA152 TaxID=1896312 RepID=UPI001660255B|nr:LysM peptidoglycan-binding domain-containing protein [Streptomyces sp. CBMA152]MBD0742954.1 hypothetical protein [Streptomyces sp. CBMA152]
MAPRTPAPLRTLTLLVRAVFGLALLAALVGGVPYLLLQVGHQPTELSGGWSLFTQQDDGSLFLVTLTLIGWAAWASFAASVLLEIVSLARGRTAPRVRGLSSLQSLAGFLIGSIVLLAPTAASAATPTPAAAAVHTTATPSLSAPTPRTSAEDAWPTHTVASATEAPWDLAVTYLGDGQRWKDIAALNPDIPALAAGDGYLPQGAVIKLPADARTTTATAHPATPTAAAPAPAHTGPTDQPTAEKTPDRTTPPSTPGSHPQRATSTTVREGDNLSLIAGKTYGDPDKWTVIYAANKGEEQPGGGHFDNPDLIFPGQVLNLPQPGTAAEPPADQNTTDPKTPDKQSQTKPTPEKTPDKDNDNDARAGAGKPSTPTATPPPARTVRPTPSSATPAPSTDRTHAPASAAQTRDGHDTALAPAAVWAGAGALAAALVGTLATRRILQQRRRRPGRRIPMPTGRAAATEQGLRAAQHGFDLLDTALRSLALNLAAAGRELPTVEAVVLHEAKVVLHLAEDTAPMTPFSAAAGRTDLWTCPASSPDLATEDQLKNADAPYPALVSIGWDPAAHLVLVDLEHVGILNLAGDAGFTRHVLQAIAVELASTPLPGHLEITALADTAPGLDHAVPERVVRIHDITDASADLTSHTNDQRRALDAVGASSLRAARLMDDAAGAWTPHVLLAQDLPHDASEALFDALAEEPRAAGAVITASTPADLPSTAWTLDCQGPEHIIALPGSHLPVKLQGLSDEHFADAMELLTLAASEADAPAPDWVRTDDEPSLDEPLLSDQAAPTAAASTGESVEPDPDEDGLPAEYAELELDALAHEDELAPSAEYAASSADVGYPVPRLDLAKPEVHDADGPMREPAAGSTLADVLAEENEDAAAAAGAKARTNHEDLAPPAADSGDALPATPCATVAAPAVRVTLPAPEPATDTDPAATNAAPAVLLLGPVSIDGASGRIDSNRLSIGTELAAYLALNPGVDHHAIDDALWPGRLVNKQMRNAVISRTRSWLGKNTDGTAHLPRVQDTGDSRYRLGPAVTCDWTQFQRFARTGLARHDEDASLTLRRALALVRARPFTGIDPQRYAWAEPIIQEMVSAVVDVAYELSTRCREANDIPGALWAASRGLLAAEESELLHRQIFLAHHTAGDIDALREAAARLVRINEQLGGGVDMEAETAELLRNLLPRLTTRTRF